METSLEQIIECSAATGTQHFVQRPAQTGWLQVTIFWLDGPHSDAVGFYFTTQRLMEADRRHKKQQQRVKTKGYLEATEQGGIPA